MRAPLDPRFFYRLADPVLEPVSAAFRARAQRRGRDLSGALSSGSALILAAHPDDEVLGCGAIIARKRERGEVVRVAIATDGARSQPADVVARDALIALRRSEALAAGRILGLAREDFTFLEYVDGDLAASTAELGVRLAALIEDSGPRQIFVTSVLDAHPDHQSLARAARMAVVATRFPGPLYEYPIWYWARLPWTHRPSNLASAVWYLVRDPIVELLRAEPVRVRTVGYLERKRAAVNTHRSQVAPMGDQAAVLSADFLRHFFQPYEVFYPVSGAARHGRRVATLPHGGRDRTATG